MGVKKFLALLLSAILAVALLAACGAGSVQHNALVQLLNSELENVEVIGDSSFDRALKNAVQRGGSDPEAVLAALKEELGLTGVVNFSASILGGSSVGSTALKVEFEAVASSSVAANAAANSWLGVLRYLPEDGAYSAKVSMVEVNGGYILAIEVTVEQPAEEDEPEPVTLTGISVSGCKTEYFVGQSFDPTGMTVTATYSDNSTRTITGITETDKKDVSWDTEEFTNAGTKTVTIFYGGKTTTVTVKVEEPTLKSITVSGYQDTYNAGDSFTPTGTGMEVTVTYSDDTPVTITGIKNNGEKGVSWEPANGLAAGTNSVTIIYTDDKGQTISTKVPVTVDNVVEGTGYQFDRDENKATITGESGLQNLFKDHKTDAASATIILKKDQTVTGTGPLTDTFFGTLNGNGNKITMEDDREQGLFNTNNGTVQNVNIEVTGTISGSDFTGAVTGAVAGINNGEISGCKVTISHPIQATVFLGDANAGGIVGTNESGGEISGCTVTVSNSIQASSSGGSVNAGGIAGTNESGGEISDCTVTISNSIEAHNGVTNSAGGIAGYNSGEIDQQCTVTIASDGKITASSSGEVNAGGIVGNNSSSCTVSCGPATGTDGNSVYANAYQDSGRKYIASVTTTSGTTTPGTTTAIWPTSPAMPMAYAGTQCGKDSNGQPSGS